MKALCSWCGRKTRHELVRAHAIRRNVYRCAQCGGRTLPCRACGAMARGRAKYDEELCFLHDGTLPRGLPRAIASLERVRVPEASGPWAGLTTAGAAIGAMFGGVAGGLAGWGVARAIRAYVEPLREFKIERIREGRGAPVLYVDGFLTQGEHWTAELETAFPRRPWYRVHWEAQNLLKLGGAISEAVAKRRSPSVVLDVFRNPWHVALWKAERTGRMLGFLLSKTRMRPCTLVGHSLGARVVFEALQTLASVGVKRVTDAHLLGAAVDRRDADAWTRAARAARIVNYWSRNDGVLKYLYVPGNLFLSAPAGLGPAPEVENRDVSRRVKGHTRYGDGAALLGR